MISEDRRRLRDTFAGVALQALIGRVEKAADVMNERERLAVDAYQLADAMLEARERVLTSSLRPPGLASRRGS